MSKQTFTISPIPDDIFAKMQGKSFKDNCTVPRDDLRYIKVLHVGFDGETHVGELVVNRVIADDVLDIFKQLYEAGYEIEKIRLIDEYDADDERSMRDNNSSAFNFRYISYSTTLSKHALGLAVDINTLYNPYVKKVDGRRNVEPANAEKYTDRSVDFLHKIDHDDLCYKLFVEHGFEWGGDWVTENSYSDSAEGGTVEITSVTDTSDENYNAAYNKNGGKSYHAATGERVTLTATAKEGYGFVGWYDESGNLVATNAEYSYVETQESVKTYYARFLKSVTQTYIRQVRSGDSWTDITDDKIGTLGRYTYTDAVGMPISSTATAGSGYKFMGWYDSNGNRVKEDMLINDGATISYTTTGNATYYARFSNSVTQTYIRQVGSGDNWKNTNDDTIGTLTHYSQTNTADATVSSQATAGKYYEFVGWYASDGKLITTSKTISGTITEGATYYARFSKKIVTQTFICQVKNGDSWEVITDDTIGTLTKYKDVGEIDNPVSSKATAGSGYRFVGWYDSKGNDANKVINDLLTDNGMTISYTTTGNATYYARFEKAYTLNVSKLDGDQSTDENKVPLAGAEFTLYQADENGEQTIVYKGASIKCTAVRTSVTALNAEGTQATAVFTDTLSPDSVYYLAETKAPTGYRLLDAPLKINFDDSGNIALIDGIKKYITENEVNVELANYLTLHMPTSGTPFTGGLFAVTGLSLLTLAAIGLFLFKISRYKSKNK